MVKHVLVIVAPGQGSQTPGFLSPWLEEPGAADRLGWLSAVADIDLVAHGTTSDADTIQDTAVAQPLLVAAGLLALPLLGPHGAGAFSGHSVGEITAAAATGVITDEQAMVLVRERGRAMARAAAAVPTGMSALLGGDPDEVLRVLEKFDLTPANMNMTGQVVAAGTLENLERLKDEPPAKARVRPLKVAGAFHTHFMSPAVEVLEGYARAVSTHDPSTRLVSNADGAVVGEGTEVLGRIVRQISRPVRWDRCQETFRELGVTALLELPSAGTLTGIAKRALPGVELVSLKTPADLPAARELIEKHAEPGQEVTA
ncbi:ACP S-malonyltransferase [Kineosporia succinea]|uniref:[acyl-carrier-protein] S-malonyltransferase n=1 Tax=Kineosporia succinea TaxID=84632 RepID=A0ABT9P634_9ACTN|nr:ACP S-malonyltransferase [Kineosporia succinea]MDP9828144.1 [acyl-carrier-protein] S-malonyltransferase [Kineosporia succinea]